MKKIIILSLIAVFLMPLAVFAGTESVGEAPVVVEPDKVIDGNYYIAAPSVLIYGTVTGDINAAAGYINLLGEVGEDVNIAGGTVHVAGTVGDDLKIVGGNVTVAGVIEGDVLMAGGNIIFAPGSVVKGDLYVAGGAVTFAGIAEGGMKMAAGSAYIAGQITGDAGFVAEELELTSTTFIEGNLTYASQNELTDIESLVSGEVTFNQQLHKDYERTKQQVEGWQVLAAFAAAVMKVLVILIAVLIISLAIPKTCTKLAREGYKNFWMDVLFGLVALVVVPILTLILFFTLFGSYVALLLAVVYAAVLLMAVPFANILAGSWLFKTLGKKKTYNVTWPSSVVGSVVLQTLVFVPVIGWVLALIFVSLAVGAGMRLAYAGLRKSEAK